MDNINKLLQTIYDEDGRAVTREVTAADLAEAARHCIRGGAACNGCPFFKPKHYLCYQDFMKNIIILCGGNLNG